jgi:tyrosine-protein phosphatase SIW14
MAFLNCRVQLILVVFSTPALAQPSLEGVKNFYQVDQHVYRGGQPDKAGFERLAKLGVKTVINLREDSRKSRQEEKLVTAAGMVYINVPMTGLTPPSDTEIKHILGLLEDQTAGPVFIHCKRGADRTGAVIGAYRVDHDGWSNTEALKEALARGMRSFQHPRQNYIRDFQRITDTVPATLLLPASSGPVAR